MTDDNVQAHLQDRMKALAPRIAQEILEEVMRDVHHRLQSPVVTGLTLEDRGLGVEGDMLTPSVLPDLFEGRPVHIRGRCRRGVGALVVHGRDARGEVWRRELEATPVGDPFGLLKTLWSRL